MRASSSSDRTVDLDQIVAAIAVGREAYDLRLYEGEPDYSADTSLRRSTRQRHIEASITPFTYRPAGGRCRP
jgi:hypothetical protein